MHDTKLEKLPFWKLIIFALGQYGWSLASYSIANVITYFYFPPQSGEAPLFPVFIYQGAIFGFMTIIGLITAGGRIFDAITDPLVANLSDRSRSKFGRRRLFLAISAIPTALFSFLAFYPLSSSNIILNTIWLVICIFLFYWFITMYCTPYNALISELGHNPNERLNISTAISITWALGFMTGNFVYALRPTFMKMFNLSSHSAFQLSIGIFAIISGIMMMLPVIFIDEKKYAKLHYTDENVFEAVTSTFKNKNFLLFLFSDLTYWLSLTFIQIGIAYYVTILVKLPDETTSVLMTLLFLLSFVYYIPINLIAKKIGKKRLLVFAFIIFAIDFTIIIFLGKYPIHNLVQAYFIVILASLPIAIFGILPNAIIADIAEAHGISTGQYKAGIFFGARTFMMKMGVSLSNLLFPSFLLLGRSITNDTGIRLTALAASIFCIVGLILFLYYNEKEIMNILKTDENFKNNF